MPDGTSPADRPTPRPPDRRPLVLGVLGAATLVLIVGVVVISSVADLPVHWGWLIGAILLVAAVLGFYLWVRLTDE